MRKLGGRRFGRLPGRFDNLTEHVLFVSLHGLVPVGVSAQFFRQFRRIQHRGVDALAAKGRHRGPHRRSGSARVDPDLSGADQRGQRRMRAIDIVDSERHEGQAAVLRPVMRQQRAQLRPGTVGADHPQWPTAKAVMDVAGDQATAGFSPQGLAQLTALMLRINANLDAID
jgi:hypothetical protein